MAFSAKLLSTSASKSTHCAFVSSPASVITVSSRSSAERAIMGAAFHASICRWRAVTASSVSRSVSGNWSMMACATSRSVCSTIHCWARAMALAKPWITSGWASI